MELSKSEQLYRRTLKFGFLFLVIFFIFGFGSAYLGKYIDGRFGTYPYGYMITLLVSYVMSIGICLIIIKKKNLLK